MNSTASGPKSPAALRSNQVRLGGGGRSTSSVLLPGLAEASKTYYVKTTIYYTQIYHIQAFSPRLHWGTRMFFSQITRYRFIYVIYMISF